MRFFFPRQKALNTGDKDVVFRLQLGPSLVEAKVSLKAMVYGEGLAL